MNDRRPKSAPETSSEQLKALVDEPLRSPLLYERKHFLQQLLAEVSFTRRHSSSMVVLLIHVECAGAAPDEDEDEEDAAVATLGHRIVSAVRAEDMVARYASEQFAVLCRATRLEQAGVLADRVLELLDTVSFESDGGIIHFEACIGVAGLPESGAMSADQVLAVAFDAMREAMRSVGRRLVIGRPPAAGA